MNATEPDSTPQRSTIRDVALEAGVSTATVSRVLNRSPKVSAGTRSVVLEAMERHGFTARRRRSRAMPLRNVVAVRCPYTLTDYFGVILSGVARSLRLRGKGLFLSAEAEEGDEASLAELLRPEMTDGAVLILPPEPSAKLLDLRAQGYPFVVIDPRTALPPDIAAVSAAHLTGSRLATEHLIKLGHRRIAAIAGPLNWIATDGRLLGYRAALAAIGHLAPEELVRMGGEPTIAHGLEAARRLLDLPDRPTGIVAFNDKIAIGAMEAAAERNLRVPEDLSVVGFDDLPLAAWTDPGLTTVRQPIVEKGRLAASLLVRLLGGETVASPPL